MTVVEDRSTMGGAFRHLFEDRYLLLVSSIGSKDKGGYYGCFLVLLCTRVSLNDIAQMGIVKETH